MKLAGTEFARTERRHSTVIRLGDCGHWIDCTEPYVYSVWKLTGADGIEQACECEFCARGPYVGRAA